MKHFTIRIPLHVWAHILAEDVGDISKEDILADLRSTYGTSIDRVVDDFIGNYEVVEESEA